MIGGVDYTYAVRGDGQIPQKPVDGREQRRAFDAGLNSMWPEVLALPASILKLLPPRPYRFDGNPRELFSGRTGLTFDPLAPAEAATALTLSLVLHPQRASRLEAQKAVDPSLPGLGEVVDALVDETWKISERRFTDYESAILRQTESMLVQELMNLASSESASSAARSMAYFKLDQLKNTIYRKQTFPSEENHARYVFTLQKIDLFQKGEKSALPALQPNDSPDGSPIDPGQEWLEPICGWRN